MNFHKARPLEHEEAQGASTCIECQQPVTRVPGGHGPIWVHGDGHVVAKGRGTE